MRTETSNDIVSSRLRWRFPVGLVLVAACLIAVVHFNDAIDSFYAAYSIPAVIALTGIVLLVWFARFSGLPEKTRTRCTWLLVGALVLGFVMVKATTRAEGVISGVGFPRLVWRWSPRAGDGLPQVVATRGEVDLSATTPDDFPQFLGPTRRNVVDDAGLAGDWTQPPKLLWREPIGLGWSSFAIVGPWAVTQEQRGDNELVVCYEVKTSRAKWVHSREHTRFIDSQGGDGPRATPTVSGGRVYVMGATGFLDCLDGSSGASVWSHNVLRDRDHNLGYGKSCSPLVLGNLVIVTGGPGGPSVLAFDKVSGSPVWTGDSETPGYASPVQATLAGRSQILSINAASVAGYDPSDGHRLWKFDWPGSMPKTLQPIAIDPDRVLISSGYGLGTKLLKIEPKGDEFLVSELWSSRHLKPKLSNNAVRGNYVYGLDDGVLTCLDLSDGKRMWRGESYGFGQVLLRRDQLLIESESGVVAMVEARPDSFHELSRFTALNSRTWSGPAVSGQYLLVRNDQEAACYQMAGGDKTIPQ